MSASVTLSDLGWSAPDGQVVLQKLNLSFGPGVTALVGRNGSGKSTLLRNKLRQLYEHEVTTRCTSA